MTEQQAKEIIFKMMNKIRAEAYNTTLAELVEEANDFADACDIMDNAWDAEIEDEDWNANGD